jgi:predicted transcriptional regulator
MTDKPTLTARILALHDAGKTTPEIAREIGRTSGQVRSALRRYGHKSRLPTGRPRKALQGTNEGGKKNPPPGELASGSGGRWS